MQNKPFLLLIHWLFSQYKLHPYFIIFNNDWSAGVLYIFQGKKMTIDLLSAPPGWLKIFISWPYLHLVEDSVWIIFCFTSGCWKYFQINMFKNSDDIRPKFLHSKFIYVVIYILFIIYQAKNVSSFNSSWFAFGEIKWFVSLTKRYFFHHSRLSNSK